MQGPRLTTDASRGHSFPPKSLQFHIVLDGTDRCWSQPSARIEAKCAGLRL